MIRMKGMVFTRAEVAFLGPSPDLITGNLSLGRRLFCWIYRQRNPQPRQEQAASALPSSCAPSHACRSQRFRGASSGANRTLPTGRQL